MYSGGFQNNISEKYSQAAASYASSFLLQNFRNSANRINGGGGSNGLIVIDEYHPTYNTEKKFEIAAVCEKNVKDVSIKVERNKLCLCSEMLWLNS
jgi:hypothetical protein